MGAFKKYVTCIMASLAPIQVYHTLPILLYNFPRVIHQISLRNSRMREKKIFAYMAASAYHVLSTEVENHILKHN